MQKLFLSSFFVVTVMFSNTINVSAWHDEGHKITGYIAWQRMTPQTRAAVIKILRAAPEDSQIAAFYPVYGIEGEDLRSMEFFMVVPTWADMVRERAFPVRNKKYHHSNWHYFDTFWKDAGGKVEILSGFEEGGDALDQLAAAEKTLRDAMSSDADKAIAIAWLMHLTGDLHQPLHNSARVTDREPKGDQGGNLFLLTPEGTARDKQLNLHTYWDGIPARSVPLKSGQCVRDYLTEMGDEMMKKHPFAKAGDLQLGQYPEWHKSGFALATTAVFTPDLVRFQMPSEKYQKAAFTLAEKQIALAGYRIGETLNSIFDTPPSPVAAVAQCQVIRKIMYPIFKLQTPENIAKTKPTIAVLNTCPTGPAARPTIMIEIAGVKTHRTFDVVKVFESEAEAQDYAAKNSITDISFTVQ